MGSVALATESVGAEIGTNEIVRATSKHTIMLSTVLKNALYDTQRASVRVANTVIRKLWAVDGAFLDDFMIEHGRPPTKKDEWPLPVVNSYQLGRAVSPGLNTGIVAGVSNNTNKQWVRERFSALILHERRPPHFRDTMPIPIRAQDYEVELVKGGALVSVSLSAGRHEGGRKEFQIPIMVSDSFQRTVLTNIVEGRWKRATAAIEKDRRGKWYFRFAYKKQVERTGDVKCAAINKGIKNWLTIVGDDGYRWFYDGKDILAYFKKMEARRKSFQRCSCASGRSGRGRGRILQPIEVLRGKAKRYRQTKNQVIARRAAEAINSRGVGMVYIENFTGIRDGDPAKLFGGKPLWDVIQRWPYYDLQNRLIACLEELGIAWEIVPAYEISLRCPKCGTILPEHKDLKSWMVKCSNPECKEKTHLDEAAARNVLARGLGEWPDDDENGNEQNQGLGKKRKRRKNKRSKTKA